MYEVCSMIITYSKGEDQPGKVVNPDRGQSLSPFAPPENLVSRDGFGSPVSRQPAHPPIIQAESGAEHGSSTGYDKVAKSARGQLNRENTYFPVPVISLRIWSRETGPASSCSFPILSSSYFCRMQ